MSRRRVASLVLLFLAASAASASTILPLKLEDLANRAESIVIGTVADVTPRFNEARSLILSDVTLAVDETIAGASVSYVTVSEYGGRVGDVELVVPGLPRFERGDRVMLFVCRDALGLPRTCGAAQGRLRVVEGGDGTLRAVGVTGDGPVDEPVASLKARVRSLRAGGAR
jgi:hypothetical protein